MAAQQVGAADGVVGWAVTAFLDGLVGLAAGLLLIPIVAMLLLPLFGLFTGRKADEESAESASE